MDLFGNEITPSINLLPKDGTVNYFGKILSKSKADWYFERIMSTVDWKNDEAIIFGKHFITKRKAAWYGDNDYAYTYSNTTKHALPWTPELMELKFAVEQATQTKFNSCLLNLYPTGEEGMGWHSDDEKSLGRNTSIASVSLGAERKFAFRHKVTKEKVELLLEHGSLLLMKDATQTNWLHRLPPTKKIHKSRINLTFRTIIL
jgi:alkylated DNA repair dioxygenase AlkB